MSEQRELTEAQAEDYAAEIRRLAGELAEEQAVLREVFARAPAVMALMWGPELRLRFCNRQALDELPGLGDLLGRSVLEALPEGSPLAIGFAEAVLGRGETVDFEDEPLPLGGEDAVDGMRYFTFSAAPVSGSGGAPAGVLVVGRDTTEAVRRRLDLERELEKEHRLVSELQVSLMPERLPQVPGADIASSFRPAGGPHEISGDFFDIFPMGPPCYMVVIGDVCGKGAEAASLTALARYTLRAAAIQEGAEPGILLAQLNEAILRQRHDMRFLSAVCGFLEPVADGALRLTAAVAGHPPPLHVGVDGAVTPVRSQGGLLGVWDSPALEEEVVDLAPGERIVLYTDGVVEAGAPRRELEQEGLARLLSEHARGTAADTVAAIEAAVMPAAERRSRDDIAILVIRADPGV